MEKIGFVTENEKLDMTELFVHHGGNYGQVLLSKGLKMIVCLIKVDTRRRYS